LFLLASRKGMVTQRAGYGRWVEALLDELEGDAGRSRIMQLFVGALSPVAPAIRPALGEAFGMPVGSRVTDKMATALRRLAFDAVFDTNFSADLTILEEGHELLERLRGAFRGGACKEPLSMFSSCCPAWIQFAEQMASDILPNLSTCKSPQQMLGAMIKTN